MKNIIDTATLPEGAGNITKIFKGFVASIIFTLVILFVFSCFLTFTDMKESMIPPIIIITTIVSILIGSSLSTIKIRKNGLINGGAVGLLYILLIYIVSSIVNTGFALTGYSLVMLIGGIIAGMLGRNYWSKYKIK